MIHHISPAVGEILPLMFFSKDVSYIKLPMKVDFPLNKYRKDQSFIIKN